MNGENRSAFSSEFNMPCSQQNGDGLKKRQQDLNQNWQTLQQWSTAKEQYEQNIRKCQNAISQQSQPQSQQQILQIKAEENDLMRYLTYIQDNLSGLSQKVLNDLAGYAVMCENLIINWTKDELNFWKKQQKIAQYGGPDALPTLAVLTKKYQIMTDYVFTAWKYAQRSAPLLIKFVNAQQVNQVHAKLYSLFCQLLNTSFLVVQQPPMIAKNRITVRVGLLGAIDKLGFESQRTVAQCQVISEESADELKRKPDILKNAIPTVGKMDEDILKEKDIERLSKENVLGFEFKTMKMKVDSRKTSAKNGEAIKKKYYLLFSCTINVLDHPFKIFALSLPFMVSVHGSQDKDLWAKAFWDMAFTSGQNEIPMESRSEVSWNELSFGLENVFSCIMNANTEKKDPQITSERRLQASDLAYIKLRLFNGQLPPNTNPTITMTKFITEPLCHMSNPTVKLDFSLWEWFFRIADMLQEKAGHEIRAKALWNLHLLEGFISKADADKKLSSCNEPTLLLRFSDNNLSSVSAVVLKDDREVDHLAPFKNKDDITDRMSLPTLVMRCEELENINFVYPNRPKKLIEDQIPQPKQPSTTIAVKDGYTSCTIKMINEGKLAKPPRKPSDVSPNTPGNNYNIGSPPTASIYSPNPVKSPPIQTARSPPFFDHQFLDISGFCANNSSSNPYNQGMATMISPQFDETNIVDNNFNQGTTIKEQNNNLSLPDSNGDTIMFDSDIIEVIYQGLENYDFFESQFNVGEL